MTYGFDLIDAGEYDGIRELLGVNAAELPDAVIEQLPFLPAAETRVKREVEDWAERVTEEPDGALLAVAVMHATALRLIPRLQNRLRPGDRAGEWSAGQIDWNGMEQRIRAGYAAAIGELVEPDGGWTPTGAFTVAGISREMERRRAAR